MNSTQDLDYGHAMCPHCRQWFDAAASKYCISLLLPGVPDRLCIFLCQTCQRKAEGLDASQVKTLHKRCSETLYSERDLNWSVTTELTLRLHGGDLAAALEFGLGLSNVVYTAVINGEIDLCVYPGIHISYAAGGNE